MKPNIKIFINIKLFLSFFFWLLCIALHKNLSNITYKLGMSINLIKEKPLYDILQVNLPNLQVYRFIPECLHIIPIIGLVSFIAHYRNENSLFALNDFFRKHGILLLFRALFFSVTLLPDSSEMCSVSTHIGSCFDLIFSGHSAIMYLCVYIINSYFYISKTVYILFHILNMITCFFIILCRNHYTIDVILSIVITHFVCHYKK